jgi:hypothetical protein
VSTLKVLSKTFVVAAVMWVSAVEKVAAVFENSYETTGHTELEVVNSSTTICSNEKVALPFQK